MAKASGCPSLPPLLWLSTCPLVRPSHGRLTGGDDDDDQRMSVGPPVLWLSTNAVQLTVPIGGDDRRMSVGPPVLWLSTDAAPIFRRLRRTLFWFSLACLFWVPIFRSADTAPYSSLRFTRREPYEKFLPCLRPNTETKTSGAKIGCKIGPWAKAHGPGNKPLPRKKMKDEPGTSWDDGIFFVLYGNFLENT